MDWCMRTSDISSVSLIFTYLFTVNTSWLCCTDCGLQSHVKAGIQQFTLYWFFCYTVGLEYYITALRPQNVGLQCYIKRTVHQNQRRSNFFEICCIIYLELVSYFWWRVDLSCGCWCSWCGTAGCSSISRRLCRRRHRWTPRWRRLSHWGLTDHWHGLRLPQCSRLQSRLQCCQLTSHLLQLSENSWKHYKQSEDHSIATLGAMHTGRTCTLNRDHGDRQWKLVWNRLLLCWYQQFGNLSHIVEFFFQFVSKYVFEKLIFSQFRVLRTWCKVKSGMPNFTSTGASTLPLWGEKPQKAPQINSISAAIQQVSSQ